VDVEVEVTATYIILVVQVESLELCIIPYGAEPFAYYIGFPHTMAPPYD